MDEVEEQNANEAGEESNEDNDLDQEFSLTQVWCVRQGKRQWYPTTQSCGGRTYMKLSKLDRGLCSLVLGLSMQRHSGKDKVTLSRKWFQDMVDARRHSCQQALNNQIAENARESGHEPPKKFRAVRADDSYLVGDSVLVSVPAVGDLPGRHMRVLWICKSADLWVELNKDNIEYIAAAIKVSPVEEPKCRVSLGGYWSM